MLCPQCKVSLTVSKYLFVVINSCPQCHGAWLEQTVLDKISEQLPLFDNSNQTQLNNPTTPSKKNEQGSQSKKRKYSHFLSGALDISDDW